MKVLETAEIGPWVHDVLLNPQREKPVVAVTTRPRTGSTWLEPKELAASLGDLADVVCLETGEPTWELTEVLPARLDVYGGAVRVWWPGLREDSNPYDHRLCIIHSATQAQAVLQELLEQVRGSKAIAEHAPSAEPIDARVEAVTGSRIELSVDGLRGELREADVPLPELARCLTPGMELRARVLRAPQGRSEFSVRGLLPSPWGLVAESLSVGDVVSGRVQSIREFGAFVEVLPQVTGFVHISELDWTFVDSVSDFVVPGQAVLVKLMSVDPEGQKLQLSVKRAHGTDPSPLPSLVPDGVPFTWPDDEGPSEGAPESVEELKTRAASLADELDAAVADRGQLAEANKQLREQVGELRKQLRSAEDRAAGLERRLAPERDPLASERGFLLAVRLAYARLFDEGTRQANPLRKMRVGGAFLESLRALDGIDVQKVLEVCAQVAADTAHELASREVHQLRSGSRGSGSVTRATDGAQAWRCALQVKTASARRLHWWTIPGDTGPTIEFAAVGLHDEFSIPE
ncbi:MAG: S1 RNA-binding domain-containing protein [Polyangiaceae bacterium]|nr:S1 RNA-binding domain-containing protein [Polyangiaceae bacterium]